MALNIHDLVYETRFFLNTNALGSIVCHGYSSALEKEVGTWLKETSDMVAERFVRFLLTKLCVISENLKDDSEELLTVEQSEALSLNELEEFCRKFIHFNHYLIQDIDIKTYKNPTESSGGYRIDYERLFRDEFKRIGINTCRDYLLHIFKDFHENHSRRTLEKFNSVSSIFSSTTRNLFEESMRLSNEIRGAEKIEIAQPFGITHTPPNPIEDTNRSINALARDIKAVSYLVARVSELGAQMNLDSAINSKKTQRWNLLMFGLGIFTLIVTAVFSYQGLTSANQSSIALERLMEQQNTLLTKQIATQEKLLSSISQHPKNSQQYPTGATSTKQQPENNVTIELEAVSTR